MICKSFSVSYSTKTRCLMFKLINFIVSCKYTFILNLMPAEQDWESCGRLKDTCLEHSTGKQVSW